MSQKFVDVATAAAFLAEASTKTMTPDQIAFAKRLHVLWACHPIWSVSAIRAETGITFEISLPDEKKTLRAILTYFDGNEMISLRPASRTAATSLPVSPPGLATLMETLTEVLLREYPDDILLVKEDVLLSNPENDAIITALHTDLTARSVAAKEAKAKADAEAVKPVLYVFGDPRLALLDQGALRRYVLVSPEGERLASGTTRHDVINETNVNSILYNARTDIERAEDVRVVEGYPTNYKLVVECEKCFIDHYFNKPKTNDDLIKELDEIIARHDRPSPFNHMTDQYVDTLVSAKRAITRLSQPMSLHGGDRYFGKHFMHTGR